jgi:hypothetical protein
MDSAGWEHSARTESMVHDNEPSINAHTVVSYRVNIGLSRPPQFHVITLLFLLQIFPNRTLQNFRLRMNCHNTFQEHDIQFYDGISLAFILKKKN